MNPNPVRAAIDAYNDAQVEAGEERDPDKFYPVPNRARIRRFRFGGYRREDGSQPQRSRIRRGHSRKRPLRGRIVREGMK